MHNTLRSHHKLSKLSEHLRHSDCVIILSCDEHHAELTNIGEKLFPPWADVGDKHGDSRKKTDDKMMLSKPLLAVATMLT